MGGKGQSGRPRIIHAYQWGLTSFSEGTDWEGGWQRLLPSSVLSHGARFGTDRPTSLCGVLGQEAWVVQVQSSRTGVGGAWDAIGHSKPHSCPGAKSGSLGRPEPSPSGALTRKDRSSDSYPGSGILRLVASRGHILELEAIWLLLDSEGAKKLP